MDVREVAKWRSDEVAKCEVQVECGGRRKVAQDKPKGRRKDIGALVNIRVGFPSPPPLVPSLLATR